MSRPLAHLTRNAISRLDLQLIPDCACLFRFSFHECQRRDLICRQSASKTKHGSRFRRFWHRTARPFFVSDGQSRRRGQTKGPASFLLQPPSAPISRLSFTMSSYSDEKNPRDLEDIASIPTVTLNDGREIPSQPSSLLSPRSCLARFVG